MAAATHTVIYGRKDDCSKESTTQKRSMSIVVYVCIFGRSYISGSFPFLLAVHNGQLHSFESGKSKSVVKVPIILVLSEMRF